MLAANCELVAQVLENTKKYLHEMGDDSKEVGFIMVGDDEKGVQVRNVHMLVQ